MSDMTKKLGKVLKTVLLLINSTKPGKRGTNNDQTKESLKDDWC